MKLRSSGILGLAIGDREITVAQVAGGPGRSRVSHLARFVVPPGASLERPEGLGAQLKAFLHDHHVSATRAVVGVPAKWLIAQDREVPPADDAAALAMLRLQAERLAVADNHELVFDVAGQTDPAKPTRVLIVGMLKQHVDRVRKMCDAAGLEPIALTATALTVSHLLGRTSDGGAAGGNRRLVVLSRQGAEVVWQTDRGPRMLRHLGGGEPAAGAAGTTTAVAALGGELRRAFTLAAGNGADAGDVHLLDDLGVSPQDVSDLSGRLGATVKTGHKLDALQATVEPRALNGATGQSAPEAFFPAVALAVAGAGRARLPIDFLDSRLAPPRPARVSRRTVLAVAAALACVVGLGFLFVTVQHRETEAADLEAQLEEMEPDLKAAQARLDRVKYGQSYFKTRTPVLDALREVTLAVPIGDPIWATGFTLRDNRKGTLQGKAADQGTVLALLGRLQANPKFADVRLQDIREATGGGGARDREQRSPEISFSITFTYTARE